MLVCCVKINEKIVGQHLREIRRQCSMTQEEVAERLGLCNGSYYARIERGEVRLTLERLYDLCEIFRVSPGTIMNGAVEKMMFGERDIIVSSKRAFLSDLIEKASERTIIAMHAACEGLYKELETR